MAIRRCFLLSIILSLMSVGAFCSPTFAQTFQELRVRLESFSGRQHSLQLHSHRQHMGVLPRLRAFELNANELVVTAVDRQDGEVYRTQVLDPRILRAEWPDENGELQGVQFKLDDAQFLVSVPDDPNITALVIYEPRWNGERFELDLLSRVAY